MRRAYRRPVTDADLKKPFELYRTAKAEEGFDAGIEMGLSAVLTSPEFLFRIERDPCDGAMGAQRCGRCNGCVYRISDLELATRLSFFLWSSIPDDELLDAAARGDLDKPAVLERQVTRMLADPRSENLVTNFASQWLHLRNLDTITPDMRLFPDFDDNLRQAFRQETEMLVDSVIRENRSVLDLLRANYTFVNERLAKHYGIPNVYGSRFRRITFGEDAQRGGLLRQGSILLVTSYPTRTSPVIRGKWILDNVLGVPPPPPPANVPALDDVKTVKTERADPRAPGRASEESDVRRVPPADGSGRLRARELRRGRPLADAGMPASRLTRRARCSTAPSFRGVAGSAEGHSEPPRAVRDDAVGETADLCDRPRRRVLRRAGAAQDCPRRERAGLPLLVDRHGHRQQHAVPDEESIMIITKKALPRRTFLRGMGATVALPLLDAMVPSMTALAQTPAKPVRRLGFVYIPMGSDIASWTPPGESGALTELSPTLSPLAPVMKHLTVLSNMELKNAYPGTHATSNAAFLSAAKAKWTESSDYYLGTTVDQIAATADGAGDAASVARAGDGPDGSGGAVRQRLCVRLPEQPVVVVADDAAAVRGASARGVRAAVRRRRQLGGSPQGARHAGRACSTGSAKTSRGCSGSSARRIAPR